MTLDNSIIIIALNVILLIVGLSIAFASCLGNIKADQREILEILKTMKL